MAQHSSATQAVPTGGVDVHADKKTKTRATNPSRTVHATLQRFLSMPTDIVNEICGHLEAVDLLNLCRTTKVLRSFLLSRAGSHMWTAARLAMGIPIFTGWSEVRFAVLLWGKACLGCNDSNSVFLSLDLQTRYCVSCYNSRLVDTSLIGNRSRGAKSMRGLHESARRCVPISKRESFAPQFRYSLGDLTDEAALRTVGSELDDLQQEENDTKQDRLGLASVRKGTRSRPNKPQEVLQSPLDLFISAKIASVHLVTNEAAAVRKILVDRAAYLRAKQIAEEQEQYRLRKAQQQHQNRLVHEAPAEKLRLNREAEQETPRLIKKAEDAKKSRIASLRPYFDALLLSDPSAAGSPPPTFNDFLHLPCVRSLWHSSNSNSFVTPESWQAVVPQIHLASQTPPKHGWTSYTAAEAISLSFPEAYQPLNKFAGNLDNSFFGRVTSLFETNTSPDGRGTLMSYPDILNHVDSIALTSHKRPDSLQMLLQILRAAGLPDTASVLELESKDFRFWAINSAGSSFSRRFNATLTWREIYKLSIDYVRIRGTAVTIGKA